MRREYKCGPFKINNRKVNTIIIDPHVDKHSDHINDQLILKLVMSMNNKFFYPSIKKEKYEYFATKVKYTGYAFKLVWLFEEGKSYLGVITAYRDRRLLK